jgi:hypothetical protein
VLSLCTEKNARTAIFRSSPSLKIAFKYKVLRNFIPPLKHANY